MVFLFCLLSCLEPLGRTIVFFASVANEIHLLLSLLFRIFLFRVRQGVGFDYFPLMFTGFDFLVE